MSWYYAQENERRGPIEEPEFQALVNSGTITPETLVWRDGLADWVPYRTAMPAPAATATSSVARAGVTSSSGQTCSQCDRSFPADEMVTYEGRSICAACKPLFFQKIREGAVVATDRAYAGFGIRFAAKLLDGVLQPLLGLVPFFLIVMVMGESDTAVSLGLAAFLLVVAGYVIFFTGKYGATPGKMACKILVIAADGSPMTYPRATGRFFAELVSKLTFNIGYLMAAFDDQKRALHDRICDTRVIVKKQ